uniref:Uncharacterized protein n=1 Tax=Oryza nivara TaxID=4536 RepID=A0A0E0G2R6_ORYNI
MELRLPMQGGIEPPRPLELTLSAMTRSWVCVLLHETPCQLQKFWVVLSRASLSVSVSSLIANGREHEMMKIAKSGMSFGQGANKRIILLLVLRASRASLSVSVSSLIANGREHEMKKIAKSGMSFGQGANKRIILLLVLWLAFAYGIFIAGCGSD